MINTHVPNKIKHPFRSISTQITIILIILLLPLNIVSILASSGYSNALEEQAQNNIKNVSDLYLNDLYNKARYATKYIVQQMRTNNHFLNILAQKPGNSYIISRNIVFQELLTMSQQEYAGDVFFYYSPDLGDFLSVCRGGLIIDQNATEAFVKENSEHMFGAGWKYAEIGGKPYILHISKSSNMYFGSLIVLERLFDEIPEMLDYTCEIIIDHEPDIPNIKNDQIGISSSISGIDMFLHIVIDKQDVQLGMSLFQRIQKSFILVYVALIPVLLLVLEKILISPLKSIRKALYRFRSGENDYRIHRKYHAVEFKKIGEDFNALADNIENLKIENYEQEMAKQKIEMQNFQLMIRPHFLQNTLGMLYSLSQSGEIVKTGDFILYLSGYFRLIYQGLYDQILFSQELDLIRGYIEIAKLQHPNNIDISYQIDEATKDMKIPSLLIHNFIENAISHALSKEKLLHITLEASIQKGYAYFKIEDNGIGMPGKISERLNSGEKIRSDDRNSHIGLYNTYHRLQMIYNGSAKMQIESEPGQGTRINIWIPAEGEDNS